MCVFLQRKSEFRLVELLDMLDSRFHIRNPDRATQVTVRYFNLKLRREGKVWWWHIWKTTSNVLFLNCRSVTLVHGLPLAPLLPLELGDLDVLDVQRPLWASLHPLLSLIPLDLDAQAKETTVTSWTGLRYLCCYLSFAFLSCTFTPLIEIRLISGFLPDPILTFKCSPNGTFNDNQPLLLTGLPEHAVHTSVARSYFLQPGARLSPWVTLLHLTGSLSAAGQLP